MQLIGRYQVQERIGEGAMADVYRAYDPGIDRVLAIKVLKPEVRQDPEYVARFLREARAAGALSHPSIVTIYDVGEVEGYPYMAMELLEGRPLDELLAERDREPAPVAQVIGIGIQLAEALAYAHQAGVVHRDVKPSNIVVGPDGSVKILDFGIARLLDGGDADNLRTQVGQVMGTPRYMSPEQVLGREIDGRSDLFSLGVILYEMISGQRAFDGANAGTLALQIIQQDPRPLSELVRQTPAGLQFVVGKLLAKKPERRYATGTELAAALRREEAALHASADEAKARRYLPMQVRLSLVMASITAVALLGAAWGVLDRQYAAMERMAVSSGSAIATFVASNAALSAVENAGLPREEQDWAPVEAFVHGAATDPNVQRMVVVDAAGVIQASTETALVGRRYRGPAGEPVVQKLGRVTTTETTSASGAPGFRFVRPIVYAGRDFGLVDVAVSKAGLLGAAGLSRWLMAGLGLVVVAVVAAVSFLGARLLAQPVNRLKSAMDEAAALDGALRLSHDRRDEFGELFDSFNRYGEAVQARLERAEAAPVAEAELPAVVPAAFAPTDSDGALEKTRILADAAALAARIEAALERTRISAPEPDDALRTVIQPAPEARAGR